MDSDVIYINETHFQGNASIELQNYTYYGLNRKLIHIHAQKCSAGIGIFVKDKLLSTFNVSVFDKSYDGILDISFISENTDVHLPSLLYIYHRNLLRGDVIQQRFMHIYWEKYICSMTLMLLLPVVT